MNGNNQKNKSTRQNTKQTIELIALIITADC